MRNRALPLALLIAASLAPVAGRTANDDAANNSSQNTNFAAEQTADDSHNTAPIPVNEPNKDADSPKAAAESKSASPAPARVEQLAQQMQTIKQTVQKRLDQQAQRIDTLEQQVKALTKRLRQLPQPDDARLENKSKSNTLHATNSGHNGDSAEDDDTSDQRYTPAGSPPTAGKVTGSGIVTHCPFHGEAADQFDVFFQAATGDALDAAIDQVQSAGLSDWFARARVSRLYVGRYGNCPLAARRRDDVHQRTGLALNIQAVQRQHASGSKPRANRPVYDYGAADNAVSAIRRAATQPVQHLVTNAPFEIVGVELRGTHHFLGVAPHGASRLGGVTWLSPGNTYGTWTLRAIRTDAGTATFAHDGRTVAVALPRRG